MSKMNATQQVNSSVFYILIFISSFIGSVSGMVISLFATGIVANGLVGFCCGGCFTGLIAGFILSFYIVIRALLEEPAMKDSFMSRYFMLTAMIGGVGGLVSTVTVTSLSLREHNLKDSFFYMGTIICLVISLSGTLTLKLYKKG